MASIRMKVNFVSVSSQWSSTIKKNAIQISLKCHSFLFWHYCAPSIKGVMRQWMHRNKIYIHICPTPSWWCMEEGKFSKQISHEKGYASPRSLVRSYCGSRHLTTWFYFGIIAHPEVKALSDNECLENKMWLHICLTKGQIVYDRMERAPRA